jgi:hypothetical protein
MAGMTTTTGAYLPTTTTTTSTTGGMGGAGGSVAPPIIPDGWVKWTGWTETCPFYYPPSSDLMPPPIVWDPCPAAPAGTNCRVMRTDWTDEPFATIAYNPRLDVHQGVPTLMFRRITDASWMEVVAELDGEVKNALLRVVAAGETAGSQGCTAQLPALNEGRWAMRVTGHDASGDSDTSTHTGGIGGVVGEVEPRVIGHYEAPHEEVWGYQFWVSATSILRVSSPGLRVDAFPWSLSPETRVPTHEDPEGIGPSQFVLVGDTLFYATVTLEQHGINVWDAAGGARSLVRFVGDYTQGAADLGTDGVDLVWSQGHGKSGFSSDPYPVRDVMTAPFATDAVTLAPRRLRSAPFSYIGNHPWHVSCGFAVHEYNNGTLVVRLADGVSWYLPPDADFHTAEPVGVTCEDVLILGRFGGRDSIARVRLDSLGPGTAPD